MMGKASTGGALTVKRRVVIRDEQRSGGLHASRYHCGWSEMDLSQLLQPEPMP